jgi:hypothetical protein
MSDPSVIDINAWRAKRGLSPQKSLPTPPASAFLGRASASFTTQSVTQAPKRAPTSALPVFLNEELLFFAPSQGQSRTALISAIVLFLLLVAGDFFDKIPHGLGWIGAFGALILGFVLWASRSEDAGDRPQLALSELGIALDPKGQRRDIAWGAIVGVHTKDDGLEAKIMVTISFAATSCQGRRPQAQTLELSSNLQSLDGQAFAELFIRMAKARCLGAQISA